jgi:hypothetical protein
MATMYLTLIIAALKAEKFQNPKCGLFLKHPVHRSTVHQYKLIVVQYSCVHEYMYINPYVSECVLQTCK